MMQDIKPKPARKPAAKKYDDFHEVMPLARPYHYEQDLPEEWPLEPIETEQAAKAAAIRILVFLGLTLIVLCLFLAWTVETVRGFSL